MVTTAAIRVSGMIRSMVSHVVNIDPVQVSYTIECYRDQKQAPQDAFDATLILKSIGQKYGLSRQENCCRHLSRQ